MCNGKIECIDIFEEERKVRWTKYSKKCPKCGRTIFYSSKGCLVKSIKKNSICLECMRNRGKNFSKKELEEFKKNQQLDLLKTLTKIPTQYRKKCPICKKTITYSCQGSLNRSLKENWSCVPCVKKRPKIDPEEKLKRYKEYYQRPEVVKKRKEYNQSPEVIRRRKEYNQRPEVIKRCKEYNQSPEVIKRRKKYLQRPEVKKRNKKNRERNRKQDVKIGLSHNISGAILLSLKAKNLDKGKRCWEDLVGYSIFKLKEHLEKQFTDGMNWENRGRRKNKNGWEMEHIIPTSFFDFKSTDDVEFKYCWSLDNLRPFWRKGNVEKGDKITLWGKEICARNLYISGTTQLRVIPDIPNL